MKKMLMFILMAGMLVTSAAAAFVPDNEVCENRNGRQLIVKTFTLLPGENPDTLIEAPFDREGYSYSYISIVKEERPFENKKTHSETVTVETDSKDLSAILEVLTATIPYKDGEYSGTLALDHTTIRTEASGYSTKSYTISDTKTYEGFERNDPSYIPKTTIKNGVTLNLQSIEWSVQGTALSGDSLVPTQYMAVAKYSAGASYQAANGYITTAVYNGEIISGGIASVVYTVTYVGEPIPQPSPEREPLPEPEQGDAPLIMYIICAGGILILAAGAAIFVLMRKNTKIYTRDESGEEYELIGTHRLSAKNTAIDLTSFKSYPDEAAVIEIESRTARKLFGRLVRIRLRDRTVSHRIERCGNENYWFTVSTITQEDETE